jgi:long-chain acyl-CoA synthetase
MVCPVPATLAELARKFGKGELGLEELCRDMDVTGAVLREVVNHAKSQRLEKFEIPGAVTLTAMEWTPDTGFTTAAMKLKRKPLQEFYKADLARMYGD